MLENLNDNDNVRFIVEKIDRDGLPYDTTADVYKVVSSRAKVHKVDHCGVKVDRIG